MNAFFESHGERSDESGYRGEFTATSHTVGPWSPLLQHAGPPTALLGRAVQRLAGLPMQPFVSRVAAEVLRPIPVGDVVVTARVLRSGARIAWCEARLAAAGAPDDHLLVVHAWVQRLARTPLALPDEAAASTPGPPVAAERESVRVGLDTWSSGYIAAVEWLWVTGHFSTPGPAEVWTRLRVDLVPGERLDGLARVLAVADSGSGISAVADPAELLYVNIDLTVHLSRSPVGELVSMSSRSTLDPQGTGLATTSLGDLRGEVGRAAQSLFVRPRPREESDCTGR